MDPMSGTADGGHGKISTWNVEWVSAEELVARCGVWKIVDMRKLMLWALTLEMIVSSLDPRGSTGGIRVSQGAGAGSAIDGVVQGTAD